MRRSYLGFSPAPVHAVNFLLLAMNVIPRPIQGFLVVGKGCDCGRKKGQEGQCAYESFHDVLLIVSKFSFFILCRSNRWILSNSVSVPCVTRQSPPFKRPCFPLSVLVRFWCACRWLRHNTFFEMWRRHLKISPAAIHAVNFLLLADSVITSSVKGFLVVAAPGKGSDCGRKKGQEGQCTYESFHDVLLMVSKFSFFILS